MNISANSRNALAYIISGDTIPDKQKALSPYRGMKEIRNFLYDFGVTGLISTEADLSRYNYTLEKLRQLNGTDNIRLIINQALDFWTQDFDTEAAAVYLDGFLRRDGFQVSLKKRYIRMNGNEAEYEDYYEVESLNMPTLHTISLISLDKEYITEHIEKARTKIDAGDCAGAITSAYTLVEGFLKELLKQTQTSYRRDEGDIRELYKLVSEPLNLNPKGENLESYLKNILQGLKSQISGLYELANKASDRHARRYNPARHHAKLAVNAAFCLCEFLLDSYNYQRERAERKQAL